MCIKVFSDMNYVKCPEDWVQTVCLSPMTNEQEIVRVRPGHTNRDIS